MKFSDISQPITRSPKRVGRGIGSGHGKTAGRGTKGQGARSGGSVRPGFEGGQNPLMQRLPKQRGFKSMRPVTQIIHTDQLNSFSSGSTVSPPELRRAGLIADAKRPVKLLGRGEIKPKLNLTGITVSKSAKALLAKAGGNLATAAPAKPSSQSEEERK